MLDAQDTTVEPRWVDLVQRIRNGDPTGMEELYQVFSKGVRFSLYRQLGARDLDDKLHDLFVAVAQAIQRGDLKDPDRLMGYIRSVLRRQVAGHIEDMIRERRNHAELTPDLADHSPDPESGAIEHQNNVLALRILNGITKRDREILIRYYFSEQAPAVICCEMGLTETQFRLMKSRAKARLAELGCRRFSLKRGGCGYPSKPSKNRGALEV